ncbi:hypothetical protein [[Mycoplasma] testudinis]|uniref:hypothetical protein n=1 Tax=[Mycoplasma] testudinis TaxID=33924 RepID=UPI000480CAAB|nr:hypothetical protein [[Mycoplasma] testudinis]
MKIYTYWMGDLNRKKKIQDKLSAFNNTQSLHSFILGPSTDEHDYLMKISKFYKDSYHSKKYVFCSDVYRFWKGSIENCCYLDATIEFDLNSLSKVLCNLEKTGESLFIKESPQIYWSGFFVSGPTLKKTMDMVFKSFLIKRTGLITTGPLMLTYKIRKTKIYKDKSFTFYTVKELFDPNSEKYKFIEINAMQSWKKVKKINVNKWEEKALKFNSKWFHLRDWVFLKLPRIIQKFLIYRY